MTAPDASRARRALLVLVVLDLIWGYSWILVKVSLRHSPPLAFGAMRAVLATASLFVALALSGRSLRPRALGACVVIGLLQTSLFNAATSFATVYGAVGKTSVLVFTMPFWTLLFARIALGETIRGAQWFAVALAAVGLVVVVDPWHLRGSLVSSLLAVGGGAVWGASAVLTKRLDIAGRSDPLSFTAWQMLIGSVPLVILANLIPAAPIAWDGEFVVALAFNGIAASGLGWLLWAWVLKRLPAGTAGMSTLAIPLIAVLSAWLQLGERPTLREICGMALIGAALLWLSLCNPVRTDEGLRVTAPD